MGILYAIEKLVFTFIGDINKIKGEHYRNFSKLIQPEQNYGTWKQVRTG